MTVKLLTAHHLEFQNLKGAPQAGLSLHLSKCHIVGNLLPRLLNDSCILVCCHRYGTCLVLAGYVVSFGTWSHLLVLL